jgi:DNA-binding GntR family transcriptional regulator
MQSTTTSTSAVVVAGRLRDDINKGGWPDGAALRQEEIAARYGVSRIPVREALNLLRDDGLVVIEANRGAYVTKLTVAEVDEVFELRLLLETHALRVATPHHDSKSLLRIEALQAQLELEDSKPAWIRIDRAFHEALYAPAARPQTLALIGKLRGRVERHGLSKLRPSSRRAGWALEHRQLIDTVRRNDVEQGITTLTTHLRETHVLVRAAIGG